MESVWSQMDLMGCLVVNAIGRKGGLALLWRNKEDIEVVNYLHNHISAWIEDTNVNSK